MTGLAGTPLREDLRAQLEEFFGEELAGVRLHAGRTVAIALSALGVHGIVFGRRVFVSPEAAALCEDGCGSAAAFLAHEICHVLQYRHLGFWTFLARYVGGYFRQGRSYARIPFEVEAFEAERMFREGPARAPGAITP